MKVYRSKVPVKKPEIRQQSFDLASLFLEFNRLNDLKMRFERDSQAFMDMMAKELNTMRSTMMRGLPGPKGENGQTPSENYLKSLIQSLIPPPIKGEKGEPGRPGQNGTSPNKEEIVKTVENRIKIQIPNAQELKKEILKDLEDRFAKRIETLNTTVRNLASKTALGSGGGGMGTIKYFKFTGDGSTTQFTLPDFPTQNGEATFVFAEGARLHNSEHFTVSGKTLTTLLTIEDGTILDGWIIT